LHDLHHVLTGYETTWIGEAEIDAWELRARCTSLIAHFLNGSGVIIGLCISPARVWRAFVAAKGQHTLYRDSMHYDSLLQMTVGEVRERLGIPPQGPAS
jgi:ubiquinone biosynthesis protein Coq4